MAAYVINWPVWPILKIKWQQWDRYHFILRDWWVKLQIARCWWPVSFEEEDIHFLNRHTWWWLYFSSITTVRSARHCVQYCDCIAAKLVPLSEFGVFEPLYHDCQPADADKCCCKSSSDSALSPLFALNSLVLWIRDQAQAKIFAANWKQLWHFRLNSIELEWI